MQLFKKSKRKNFFSNKRIRALVIIGVTILVIVIAYIASGMLRPSAEPTTDEKTYVISGQVTRKRVSCGGEILQPDGSVKRGGGVCDVGNMLTVNGINISTGGGCLCAYEEPYYISDIDNIHAGDYVEIRYIKKTDTRMQTTYNHATEMRRTIEKVVESYSTNCASCYVKLQGQTKFGQTVHSRQRNTGPTLPTLQRDFSSTERGDSYRGDWFQDASMGVIVGAFALISAACLVYYTKRVRSAKKRTRQKVLFRIPVARGRAITIKDSSIGERLLLILIVITLLLFASFAMSPNTYLNSFINCRTLPVEIYSSDEGTFYRLPGDWGYNPFSPASDFTACPDQIVGGKLRNTLRDPATDFGKQQQIDYEAEQAQLRRDAKDAVKQEATKQEQLRKEAGYIIYVPEGLTPIDLELRDYREQPGYETYGIMTSYKLKDRSYRVTTTKVTPENDSLCATKGERYSDCQKIGTHRAGSDIERNFKAHRGIEIGTTIGSALIAIEANIIRDDTPQNIINFLRDMEPYRD